MTTFTGTARPAASTRSKIVAMYVALGLINLFAWVWAYAVLRTSPALVGTAFLAYSFGLRHAMDADHIAAIDNVTRRLMNDGKRPICVGFFFALGHSLTVVIGAIIVAMTAQALVHYFDAFRETGTMIGTAVSASFLLGIGAFNAVLLAGLVRALRSSRAQPIGDPRLPQFDGNLLARVFRPLFRFVRSSWLMFPLGILFGLGFETATEVALLGTSASQASAGLSMWTILMFPCLFAAGMLSIDTTDGILMLGAYDWAFVKPLRKLYYNVTITSISTIVALLVGSIEALGIASRTFSLSGQFWHFVKLLNDNFGMLGYAIIGIFIAGWIVSALLYKLNGYERGAAAA